MPQIPLLNFLEIVRVPGNLKSFLMQPSFRQWIQRGKTLFLKWLRISQRAVREPVVQNALKNFVGAGNLCSRLGDWPAARYFCV